MTEIHEGKNRRTRGDRKIQLPFWVHFIRASIKVRGRVSIDHSIDRK